MMEGAARLSLHREVTQFAGETLYAISGCSGKKDADIDRALIHVGLPLRLLKIFALLLSAPGSYTFGGVLGVYLSLFLAVFKRLPLRILLVLAVLYRVHGRGGDEFLRYEDSLNKQVARLMKDQGEGFDIKSQPIEKSTGA
jgi:hypothetical protein